MDLYLAFLSTMDQILCVYPRGEIWMEIVTTTGSLVRGVKIWTQPSADHQCCRRVCGFMVSHRSGNLLIVKLFQWSGWFVFQILQFLHVPLNDFTMEWGAKLNLKKDEEDLSWRGPYFRSTISLVRKCKSILDNYFIRYCLSSSIRPYFLFLYSSSHCVMARLYRVLFNDFILLYVISRVESHQTLYILRPLLIVFTLLGVTEGPPLTFYPYIVDLYDLLFKNCILFRRSWFVWTRIIVGVRFRR